MPIVCLAISSIFLVGLPSFNLKFINPPNCGPNWRDAAPLISWISSIASWILTPQAVFIDTSIPN